MAAEPVPNPSESTDRTKRFSELAEAMFLRLGKWPLVASYTGIPLGAFRNRRHAPVSAERVATLEEKYRILLTEQAPAEPAAAPAPQALLGKELRTDVMEINPAMATQWLEERAPNRNVSDVVVGRYARDMARYDWKLNGEAIIFDINGRLIDGQHRLWAVLESGATIKSVVVWGAQPDVIETIDGGRKRNFADALQIAGHANTREISAAARWLVWEEAGSHGKLGTYTPAEHHAAIDAHPLVLEAASIVVGSRAKGLVPKGMLVWVVTRAMEQDRGAALDWLEQLGSGVGLSQDHPCYLLRERLIADKTATRRLDPLIVAAYVVKSWVAYRDGKTVKHLRWAPDRKDRPERFPSLRPEEAPGA